MNAKAGKSIGRPEIGAPVEPSQTVPVDPSPLVPLLPEPGMINFNPYPNPVTTVTTLDWQKLIDQLCKALYISAQYQRYGNERPMQHMLEDANRMLDAIKQ